ncbi:Holliday junction resolvase RecU [Lysinibacillus sp. 54212]|uniref:Holliday junction resolvase RecU n=1 Tax=Lysinibacillus sp. 54212 TaxID=3119829 RepID=UPI002FCB15DF
MTIRYPNGKVYKPNNSETPVKKQSKNEKKISFSNRGKTLEDDLNETNQFYNSHGLANVHKKPVPIQIVKVEYPSRSTAVIREAYFRTPSTTDYNGVWNGYYIDFEAKETESKTSFPLKNIHAHQITHMRSVVEQQGIAFFIVRFSSVDRYFVVPFDIIEEAWHTMESGGRKSIRLAAFEEKAVEIQIGFNPRIDYLAALKKIVANK